MNVGCLRNLFRLSHDRGSFDPRNPERSRPFMYGLSTGSTVTIAPTWHSWLCYVRTKHFITSGILTLFIGALHFSFREVVGMVSASLYFPVRAVSRVVLLANGRHLLIETLPPLGLVRRSGQEVFLSRLALDGRVLTVPLSSVRSLRSRSNLLFGRRVTLLYTASARVQYVYCFIVERSCSCPSICVVCAGSYRSARRSWAARCPRNFTWMSDRAMY